MDAAWPVGGGEMGGRIRDHDWSGTALGPIAAWPQSLRTAVDLLLDSGFPAVITWGPDGLLLYNTGYVGIIGSHHPAALGEPSVDQFSDAWPAFEPVCERVWAGDIVTLADRLYPLMRGGVLEDAWFTVSNSPLRDERGAITGIYSTMIETTSRMRSEIALRQNDERQTLLLGLMRNQRSLTAPDRMMEAAATAIGRYLGADRTGFFELDGGDTATYGPGWVNGTLPLLTGSFDASETGAGYLAEVRAGRTQGIADLDQDPVTTHSMFIEIGARTGIRAPIIRNGRWRAGLDVHHARVREWVPEDIALIREVADQTWDAVERQRADAALRKSRAQLERQAQFLDTTLSSVSDLILMWDQGGHVVYANRALERLWGMKPLQYIGKTTEELGYPPELNERFAQEIAQVIETRAAVSGEVPYTSPTGQFGYFDYVFSPVAGESGEIEFVACAAHDSTERRQSEAALRESEARYRALFESIDQGFCTIEMIMDEQGKPVDYLFLEVNPAFARYTGLEGAVGKRMRDLHPDHEDFWFEAYGQVMLSGEPMRFEAEAAQLNRWYGVLAYRVGDPHPRRVAVLFEDITERKQADEALLESEARFRAIANVVPDLLWSNDLTGRATWCNQRMLDYVGMSFDTLRAFGWLDVIHPADRDQSHRHYAANISVGQAFQREHRLRRHDGVYRWFLARAEPMLDEAGQTVQWFGTCSDIHEARMARDELEERVATATVELRTLSRRLLEVQEEERRHLARELHDEIGQALTALQLQLVNGRRGGHQGALADAEAIVRELTSHVSALSMDLRPAALDPLGLLPALLWYVERYQVRTGVKVDLRHHGLDRRLAPDIEIAAYRVVQEALTNVAHHAGSTSAMVQLLADDAILTVVIRDHGQGFDLESTAPNGGLSGMRERVELLGGGITFEAAAGGGVAVTAELPIALMSDSLRSGDES